MVSAVRDRPDIRMIPTPESISRLFEEQIRSAALATTQPPSLWRRTSLWVQALWHSVADDPVRFVLLVVIAATTAGGLVLYAVAWPPGGGCCTSELVVAQGASLVFVTIVIGLIAGPLQASRDIDWDAGWIGREPLVWAGFGSLAFVSLLQLLIAWSQPDSTEELASILLSAVGLALAGLIARRLISLGDPAAQLDRRTDALADQLTEAFEADASAAHTALTSAEVEDDITTAIITTPSQRVQRVGAFALRMVMSSARSASTRGEWSLASRAHVAATRLAHQYILKAERIQTDDQLLQVFRQESEDLHEMAGGPAGRWFSLDVVRNSGAFAAELIRLDRSVDQQQSFDSHGATFAAALNEMMSRRLTDTSSGDVHEGLMAFTRMADAELEIGHPWGAAHLAERVIPYAVAGAVFDRPDIGPIAWSELLRLLVRISSEDPGYGTLLAFRSIADTFVQAIDAVPQVPSVGSRGFDPVLGYTMSRPTLNEVLYQLWDSDESLLEEIRSLSFRVMNSLTRMLEATEDEHTKFAKSDNVTDVCYNVVAAAVRRTRTDHGPAVDAPVVSVISSGMWHLRNLMFDGDVHIVRDQRDIQKCLRSYFSAWQMALYAIREEEDRFAEFTGELEAFLGFLDVITVDFHQLRQLRDGLHLLQSWLAHEGQDAAAHSVAERLDFLPEPQVGLFGPGHVPMWGPFADVFSTYAGGMMGPFYGEVAHHFDYAAGPHPGEEE